MTENGDGLVFLLSQPRSGSTMLQRMLGGHPDVHTVGEPWLMLTPFHARWKGRELHESLNLDSVHRDFLANIPHGQEEYTEGVRRMYGYLYQRILAPSGKRLFLDKTPRYFWIIPELCATFPAARFLVLFRNPLAVLNSLLHTQIQRRWIYLREWKGDIVDAPGRLVEAIELLGPRAKVLHYEALISDPESESRSICEWLGIPFDPCVVEYGPNKLARFGIGDPVNVYSQSRPTEMYAGVWKEKIHDPQVWRLLSDYLELLGAGTLSRMGYRYGELRSILDECRPARLRLAATLPLSYILKLKSTRSHLLYHDIIRFFGAVGRRGILRTFLLAYRRARGDWPPD